MSKKYTPAHIANYFIASARDQKIVLTPLKLMKMIYFSYAWHLYLTSGEDIQAWKHGPVIPSIYHEFKHFGLYSDMRSAYATYIDLSQEDAPVPQYPIVDLNELQTNDILNKSIGGVWFYYKDRSGDELEDISHTDGSVWRKYYQPGENIVINRESEKRELIATRAKTGYEKALETLSKSHTR